MSDPHPDPTTDPIELARALLHDVEPPTGASARVRLGVERATATQPAWSLGALAGLAVATAVVGAVALRVLWPDTAQLGSSEAGSRQPALARTSPPSPASPAVPPVTPPTLATAVESPSVRVVASSGATRGDAPLDASSSLPVGTELRTDESGSARLAIEGGVVDVAPRSTVVAHADGVAVRAGTASLTGQGTLEAGPCGAAIQGHGEVTWVEHVARFRVLGSAQTRGPSEVCVFEVVLDAPSPVSEESSEEPTGRGARDSDLAAMMRAVRDARALRGHDDRAALASWRAIRRRWPGRGLDEEIDLYVVDALVGLGDDRAARAEARRFLVRHPASAHGERMRRIAEADEQP